MKRGIANQSKSVLGNAKGGAFLRFLFGVLVLGILGVMVAFVYFGWQTKDLSGIEGRSEVVQARENKLPVTSTDLVEKIKNGYTGDYEVRITEAELNRYIASKVTMTQGGFMKGFATVKGIYVELKKGEMEIFIEREIAQYGEAGEAKTDVFKPFDQTVSMRLKISTVDLEEGGTQKTVDFPGGSIGNSPAPGMFVKLVKDSYDQLKDHFATEIDLGYDRITSITIEDGYLVLDPRKRTRLAEAPLN